MIHNYPFNRGIPLEEKSIPELRLDDPCVVRETGQPRYHATLESQEGFTSVKIDKALEMLWRKTMDTLSLDGKHDEEAGRDFHLFFTQIDHTFDKEEGSSVTYYRKERIKRLPKLEEGYHDLNTVRHMNDIVDKFAQGLKIRYNNLIYAKSDREKQESRESVSAYINDMKNYSFI